MEFLGRVVMYSNNRALQSSRSDNGRRNQVSEKKKMSLNSFLMATTTDRATKQSIIIIVMERL